MTATVAEVMVATLKASGVRRVYGIPGDSLNGFTDALRRDGRAVRREPEPGAGAISRSSSAALVSSSMAWDSAARCSGGPPPAPRAVRG
jgi:pyruvate dehydrogenase (quinone)